MALSSFSGKNLCGTAFHGEKEEAKKEAAKLEITQGT